MAENRRLPGAEFRPSRFGRFRAGGSHKRDVISSNYSEKTILNLADALKYTPNFGVVVYIYLFPNVTALTQGMPAIMYSLPGTVA